MRSRRGSGAALTSAAYSGPPSSEAATAGASLLCCAGGGGLTRSVVASDPCPSCCSGHAFCDELRGWAWRKPWAWMRSSILDAASAGGEACGVRRGRRWPAPGGPQRQEAHRCPPSASSPTQSATSAARRIAKSGGDRRHGHLHRLLRRRPRRRRRVDPVCGGLGEDGALEAVTGFAVLIDQLARRLEDALRLPRRIAQRPRRGSDIGARQAAASMAPAPSAVSSSARRSALSIRPSSS